MTPAWARIWARLRTIPDEEQARVVIGEIFAGACAGAALPGLLETVQRFAPSIIVRESMEYAAVIVGDKLGIPHVRVSITSASKDDELLSYALPALDKHREGLAAPPDAGGASIANEPVLTLFPAALDAPRFANAEFLRFRAPRLPVPSLPDWWPSGAGDPFVYVTLGTVAGSVDVVRDTYRAVLAAVGGLPLRVLFTIGAELPIESLGEVPVNVRVERFVPQDECCRTPERCCVMGARAPCSAPSRRASLWSSFRCSPTSPTTPSASPPSARASPSRRRARARRTFVRR